MTDRSAIADDVQDKTEQGAPAPAPVPTPPVVRQKNPIEQTLDNWRNDTIRALPANVINNSSNVLGAMHIAAEVLMLKSSGLNYVTTQPGSRHWYDYFIQPPKNVFKELVGKSSYHGKAVHWGEEVKNFFNLEKASKLDWQHAVEETAGRVDRDDHALKPRLVNRWQTRATTMGIFGWGLSMVLPEAKETPDDIERMTRMWKENPIGYIGTRMWQAVDVPHWSENKAQLTGGSVFLGGICSTLAAWRGIKTGGGTQKYYMNTAYAFQGCLTMLAGTAALFGVTKEDSYRNFGTIMLGKIPLLPANIAKRFTVKSTGMMDEGRWYYVGAHTLFQTQNTAGFLIGGAQKSEDGTIMDQKAIREQTKLKVMEERREKQKHDLPHAPDTKVVGEKKVQRVEQEELRSASV